MRDPLVIVAACVVGVLVTGCGLLNGATDGKVGPPATLIPDLSGNNEGEGEGEPACADGTGTLETDDGLTLAYDFQYAGDGKPGVVLVHETPQNGFDRRRWSRSFRDKMVEAGVTVLNLDRRGAGDSEGNAVDADDVNGWLDLQGALLKLQECGVGAYYLNVVAASTGTTTAYDYLTYHHVGDDSRAADPLQSAVLLSAGTWTNSNQGGGNPVDTAPFANVVTELLYAEDDADPGVGPWHDSLTSVGVPPNMTVTPITGTHHGTAMLDDSNPANAGHSIGEFVVDFVASNG